MGAHIVKGQFQSDKRLLALGEGPLLLAIPRELLAHYEQLVTMANTDHEYAHLRDRWARTVAILRAHVAHLDATGEVPPPAPALLAQVRAIVEAYYQDEHAEGRPAASWVLGLVREAMAGGGQ